VKKLIYPLSIVCLSLPSFGLEHTELMWGVKNKGTPITVDVNPLQTYQIQARANQDINLLPPVKGKKIKVAVLDTGLDLNHPDLKNFIFKNKSKCEAYEKLVQCLIVDKKAEEEKQAQIIRDRKNKKTNEEDNNTAEKKSQIQQCREDYLQESENIYPADCYGWSVLDIGLRSVNNKLGATPNNIIGRPDFTDDSGHGTHVTGTILSVTENIEIIPVQVNGVGPNQPIKPYSIDLSPNENIREGYKTPFNLSERVARGFIYAMNSGAQVINFSLGWPEALNTEEIRDAITEAQRRGIIIVAAAGNDSTSSLLRPCQYKNVICVAASRPDGALASFTNFGFGVDIAAPGVEILSTIPLTQPSARFPGYMGYDYLSGTSQATPFVTGVVAEMLSRGIPSAEIYPRLILGARQIQKELPVIVGPVQSKGVEVSTETSYTKNILSGLLDMKRSMEVQAQTLILPADKEMQIIDWDRKSADLSFQFKIKNYWKELKNKKVSIQLRSSYISEIEPAITQAQILENDNTSWPMNEERSVQVKLQIRDQKNPSLSRLPRELSYQVYVMIDGHLHRQFEIKAEVLTNFTKEIADPEITTFPIVGSIAQGQSLFAVDEIYDNDQLNKDYFLISTDSKKKKAFSIALMKMNQDHYEIKPTQTIAFDGDIDMWRPRFKMRMDIDGDGISEYILGVIEYLDKDLIMNGPYRNHFFVFDQDMRLKKTYLFDDKRMAIPVKFFWMKLGKEMRPAWVAKGPEIKKKWDITDLWGVDDYENVKTRSDIRFYYLNQDFKLTHVDVPTKLTRIADVIQPTRSQMQAGVLPVLISRNLGTELKPSYVNEFTIGEITNGVLSNVKKVDRFNTTMEYRNLVDTYATSILSLDTSATEFRGIIWTGFDAHRKQRATLLDLEQSKIFDELVNSQRAVFDAPLQIRAGFQSADRRGVYLLTNSEIEYHDFATHQVATRSLNRYSFIGEGSFMEIQNPITILDRSSPNSKLPGLYTTEGSGISKGIKVMIPYYSTQGKTEKIISPARLSFKSGKGCRSQGDPIFLGEGSGYAIDYYCGDQIKRLLLRY
jgi:subtilisin family serine protease